MKNLKNLKEYIKEYGAKIMFEPGQIFVIDEDEGVYVDIRQKFDRVNNVHDVYACIKDDDYYDYVCPNCGKLHSIHQANTGQGLYTPGCANTTGKGRQRMFGYIGSDGQIVKLPLMKFRFHRVWKRGGF